MFVTGINPTSVRTSAEGPEVSVGTIGFESTDEGPKGYIYVAASENITGNGYVCLVDGSNFTALMANLTTSAPGAGAGKLAGVARAAIANGGYGWLQIFGKGTIRVAASAIKSTLLNTTATSGQLDDDATASSEVVDGIALCVTNGGSAGTVAGYINWPRVGRTL